MGMIDKVLFTVTFQWKENCNWIKYKKYILYFWSFQSILVKAVKSIKESDIKEKIYLLRSE